MVSQELIDKFNNELAKMVKQSIEEIQYRPTLLIRMANEEGFYHASRKLISKPENTEGFTRLLLEKRTDLSIEYLVVQPKYESLFTEKEIKLCKQRLDLK
ncbi:MAG: hypothetical protein ACK5MD_09995 [Flavobacteriales bacterium]